MGDIYDDIDEILSADENLDAACEAVEEDTNFNESELEDIMSEIESLEKEFEGSETIAVRNPLQDEVERELIESMASEACAEMTTECAEQKLEEIPLTVPEKPKTQVIAFEKPKDQPAMREPVKTNSQVSFAAQGTMALNLDFKIGEETARLTIDPVKGLTVSLSGVDLFISESEGCQVVMENGMKFTIPLSSLEMHKKKTA